MFGRLWGGYVSLFHFVFLLTFVFGGVGGAVCVWYCGICRFSIVVLMVSIWFVVPMLLL
jgi:hypothetical protein